MFTEKKPNGEWRVKGIDFKDCTSEMYGALCKLRDYEATGLEPDDFNRRLNYTTTIFRILKIKEKII